jgi:hypothetical protein
MEKTGEVMGWQGKAEDLVEKEQQMANNMYDTPRIIVVKIHDRELLITCTLACLPLSSM